MFHSVIEIKPNKNLLQPSNKLRDKNTFFIPYAKTNAYTFSFFPSGIREWNGLPEQTRKTNNLTAFKTLIKMQDYTRPTDERRTQ